MSDGADPFALVDFGKLIRVLPLVSAGLAVIAILPWALAMPSEPVDLRGAGWMLGVGTSIAYPVYLGVAIMVMAHQYRHVNVGKEPKFTVSSVYRQLFQYGFYVFVAAQVIALVLMWV